MNYIGMVLQLVSDVGDTAVKLHEVNVNTADNYLRLRTDHGNYSAIFSLLLTSQARKLPITIRVFDGNAGYIQAAGLTFPI